MSTDTEGQRKVVSQDEYEQQTADTRWVELEDGDGYVQVREVAPLRLIRDMKKYGVAGLLGGDDDVDIGEMVASGQFGQFIEQTVLPNIEQPNAYWDDVGDGDFDLAALTPNDLMAVITGMTGQDREDLDEQMDETFRG